MTRHIGISVPHRRVEDDDDIQEYKKPWVGLTDDEVSRLAHHELWVKTFIRKVEEKLRNKNT